MEIQSWHTSYGPGNGLLASPPDLSARYPNYCILDYRIMPARTAKAQLN
ncbi:hypothetical protein OOU_Y34scaffold00511g18 [Pyricularia oryzae Y34]|uniref:Uncharacterized protein n=2 Tax=Pyricularia oryzae TaxID=318829 RepID=A0A4P7N8Q2_PYROR|nr:hypothetical protein OOU_Y34scaffold00511g18 [Pyricularia oryzae Y34]QBZ59097.1 hypothetical protein PoMZ_04057 [Pyricularia oryzae]